MATWPRPPFCRPRRPSGSPGSNSNSRAPQSISGVSLAVTRGVDEAPGSVQPNWNRARTGAQFHTVVAILPGARTLAFPAVSARFFRLAVRTGRPNPSVSAGALAAHRLPPAAERAADRLPRRTSRSPSSCSTRPAGEPVRGKGGLLVGHRTCTPWRPRRSPAADTVPQSRRHRPDFADACRRHARLDSAAPAAGWCCASAIRSPAHTIRRPRRRPPAWKWTS